MARTKRILRRIKNKRIKKHNDELYIGQITNLGIRNEKAEGEDEWIKKWSGFSVKPNPIYYRMFRKYDGDDARIVPEDICRMDIEACLNPERFRGFYHDKNSWDLFFPKGIFPKTILRCIDGIFYDANYIMLPDFSDEQLFELLKNGGHSKFAVKPTRDSNSSQGFNSIRINENSFSFGFDENKRVSINELLSLEGKNFIIQPFMKQSEYMSQFCSTSVNPIRIQTYRSVKDGKVVILPGSVLRVGCEGEDNDGTHGNGKIIGIDNSTGRLSNIVLDYNGNIQHEFNGVDYNKEYMIPNFEKVINLAKNVAEKVIHHRLLAFDIMLDENNLPIVFEFNIDYYSMWISQFSGQVAFGEYTDEIIEYTRNHVEDTERVLLV